MGVNRILQDERHGIAFDIGLDHLFEIFNQLLVRHTFGILQPKTQDVGCLLIAICLDDFGTPVVRKAVCVAIHEIKECNGVLIKSGNGRSLLELVLRYHLAVLGLEDGDLVGKKHGWCLVEEVRDSSAGHRLGHRGFNRI